MASRGVQPGQIRNKIKRAEVFAKQRALKKKQKDLRKAKRKREAEELGEAAPPKQVPRTIENTREFDETVVKPNDEEVLGDEAEDEFAPYFSGEKTPKVLITTRPRPSRHIFKFIEDLLVLIPESHCYKRRSFELKDIVKFATNRDFTHLIVLGEKAKVCNSMIICHLGAGSEGPTATFKVSNFKAGPEIAGHGAATSHLPEIILNNFNTRLGHRVGRLFGSLFPHSPEFKGRRVATFHNQRDFVFVRHHRYIFNEKGEKVRLQELGPRFTLKMRSLQVGTFDTKHGEYEWIHKRKEMDTSRRRFFL